MNDHAVVIAGGGPTGLVLAAELKLAGIDVAIVERRPTAELVGSRAGGLHARTIELFDQRGIVERFLAKGTKAQVAGFAGTTLDISDFPTRHNYGLGLWQKFIERILADWAEELAVPIYRNRDVTGFTQDETGVDISLSEGGPLRAMYLVGCDGGRSLVRKTAGIGFPGLDPTTSNIIAEVDIAEEPTAWGIRRDTLGIHALSRMEDGKTVRVLITEKDVLHSGEATMDDLKAGLIAVYGTDFGVHNPTWLSRFTDATRQAATYRQARVFLAGDAAHIHAPDGGQGLNLGVHDAVNLGWKLAHVIKGFSPESLLDTYHNERHPLAARALKYTMASVAVRRADERTTALRENMGELLTMDEPRKRYAGIMTGLDVHYPLNGDHPLVGRRMPDLDVETADGPLRLYRSLHQAQGFLLNLGTPDTLDIAPWAGRLRRIDARYAGPWELPVLGVVPAPKAVLVRPDGYVAWVGDGTDAGLKEALTMWFGAGA